MAGQKDNSTGAKKIALRRAALREIESPSIVESHGGYGYLFLHCYAGLQQGVVFETDERKANRLAEQRPGWAVYENDCVPALEKGVGFQFAPNFFDLDPYGECWHVVDAIFAGLKLRPNQKPPRMVFVVNDGLRQKLRLKGAWHVGSLEKIVQRHGNDGLYKMYLEVCQELIKEKASAAGYRLARWTGYYCGSDMTHFAAVLQLNQIGSPPA